jgi:Zn-dependent protease with chaperone function
MCAVTSATSLALLAWTLAGLPLVAAVGAWSGDRLHRYDPVSPMAAKLANIALTVLACAIAWTAIRRVRTLRTVRRACRRLGTATGRLVVLDTPDLEAFAIPAGRKDSGRIVVSTGMLRTLSAAERQVLLAHETAHLHHRHRILATLIAAADPLLATLPAAIHHLTERWADEDAAAVTDRNLAARTLARAALANHHTHQRSPADGAVLCYGQGDVPRRVRALLADTPPRHRSATALLAALLTGSLLSAAEASRDTAQLFDHAGDHYHARPLSVTTAISHEARHLLTVFAHRLTQRR